MSLSPLVSATLAARKMLYVARYLFFFSTGVKAETFEKMVEIVRLDSQNKQKPGRPGKISVEDQVLMTLEKRARYRYLFSQM